ncbi:hypothetical protein NL676_018704 [Syzygium grande]|nr:hypothetical protein NL676_018704 [Syzygium grande]
MMSASSSSAAVRVEKATSDLLMNPDWTMNIDICDFVNSYPGQAREVIKAVKKRLQHKSSQVQFLALTLLETMVKNCGEYVHFQIAEKNILGEMVKIVKKKTDMNIRNKILVLLDAWQEAFGGPGGKHPQYYYAYDELRRSGVQFPQRSSDAAPIFTPPVTHPTERHPQAGYGMPINSTRRLDEAMATEIEHLSLSTMDSMWNIMELLSEMLQAVNPSSRESVKDEIIVDLVNQCRSNQKKLMQMLTTTSDEELLARGLELNDGLQIVLAKHDSIASGSPLPNQTANFNSQLDKAGASGIKQGEVKQSEKKRDASPRANAAPSAPPATLASRFMDEEDEEEDDFAQLARRHSKPQNVPGSTSAVGNAGLASMNSPSSTSSSAPSSSAAVPADALALALPDPPAPVKTTKDQDMIDFLSLALTTTAPSPQTPHTPSSNQNMNQVPVSPSTEANPYATQNNSGSQGQLAYSSYVVPWAQPQPQLQPQPQPHLQSYRPFSSQIQPQYSSPYPPPPWASGTGYSNHQHQAPPSNAGTFWPPRAETPASYTPPQGIRPLQSLNSFPARGSNGPAPSSVPSNISAPPPGQKPFVPSYRLFEDLNVLGNANGRLKTTSGGSPTLSGSPGPSMVGGRK